MTEAEWLNCTDPTPMLEFLRSKASERKLRLFAVACCRQIERLILKTKRGYRAVVIAERIADGHRVDENVLDYRIRVNSEAFSWIDCWRRERENNFMYFAGTAAAHALGDCRQERSHPFDLLSCSAAAALAVAHWCRKNDRDPMSESVFRAKLAEQIPILRDIFGNPFRPVTDDPSWLTSTAVALAQTIYDDRAFDRLPILADALEEAGCDDADLLSHLRGDGPHVRGCWAVDLMLGKG